MAVYGVYQTICIYLQAFSFSVLHKFNQITIMESNCNHFSKIDAVMNKINWYQCQ